MSRPDLDLSFVIPFKDWGTRRLRMAATTALESLGSASGEVIVSDYGSTMPTDELERLRDQIEALGARYVRTDTDGVWSRSRALNAGFAGSRGRVLVSADADMLTPPGCLESAARIVINDPRSAVYFTCVDLPEGWDDAAVEREGIDWGRLLALGTRRPRWGMGLNAVSRETFDAVRGWDERFRIYGGEDNDFAVRIRRVGTKIVWPTAEEFKWVHMWHPSTAAAHAKSEAETSQVLRNKAIAKHDQTVARNTDRWLHRPDDARPLVSVVISTFNRRSLLEETIRSVMVQSMQDFEVVVVDDGSTDDTSEWLMGLTDSRIRHVHQDNAGIAAARNRGLDEARGHYVAVLDDDDLMLPWRLEAQVAAMTTGVDASFGSFVNFDNSTGAMRLYATREMTLETAVAKGGAPGHSTWLVRRELMARVRYDEKLTSGVDNDLALRLLRTGAKWRHTGRVLTLRRMHGQQVTTTDSDSQLHSASSALNRLQFSLSRERLARAVEEQSGTGGVTIEEGGQLDDLVAPFLPDHLVQRSRLVRRPLDGDRRRSRLTITHADGTVEGLVEERISWAEMSELGAGLSESPVVGRTRSAGTGPMGVAVVERAFEQETVRLLREGLTGTAGGDTPLASIHTDQQSARRGSATVSIPGGRSVSITVDTMHRGRRVSDTVRDWLTTEHQSVATTISGLAELRALWLANAVHPGEMP